MNSVIEMFVIAWYVWMRKLWAREGAKNIDMYHFLIVS